MPMDATPTKRRASIIAIGAMKEKYRTSFHVLEPDGLITITHKPCPKDKHQVQSTYSRKDWPHWVDADNDCQDTRAEILIRDSLEPVKFKRNKGCNVSWGRWTDPYTGQTFTKASDMDVDHVVPLKHAHENGGADWSREQKREFANDFDNLLAVDDIANQTKGDRGPSEWKPPFMAAWCDYAKRWRSIKSKYGLSINVPEEKALVAMERTCR